MDYLVKITYDDNTNAYLCVLHATHVYIVRELNEATKMDKETADRWVHWFSKPEPMHYTVATVQINVDKGANNV
jgi:hypothetical protein